MIILAKKLSSLDNITANEELKQKTKQVVLLKSKKKWHYKKQAIAIFSLACVLAIAFIPKYFSSSKTSTPKVEDNNEFSYITVDVNPSFELVLNKEDIVLNIITYNDEAKEIIKLLGYKDKEYMDVLQQLLSNEEYLQYILEDGYMQVSVYSKNKQKSISLESQIDQYLSTTVVSQQYQSGCVDKQTHHAAKQCHMSSGRYSLIQEIMALDTSYTMNALETMSIQELRTIYLQLTGQEYSMHQQEHHQNRDKHHVNKH